MGRAQSQTRAKRRDFFAGVLPKRRGIKNEGLLAEQPTHYDRAELAILVEGLHAGQVHQALHVLQEHAGKDTPLLRKLYEETLDRLLYEQERRTEAADTYLTILGVQREFQGEACMFNEVSVELEHLPPSQRGKGKPLVHLRLEGQSAPVCYEEIPPRYEGYTVPYVVWKRAIMQPGKQDRWPCALCLAHAQRIRGTEESVAWFDGKLEKAASAGIRTRMDVALRKRLRSPSFITPRTGFNLATKQYKYGVCAPAGRILRSDQKAFEELCFLPEQKELMQRLQTLTKTRLREVLSEEKWLEMLVRNFPSSIEQALSSGVRHGYYGKAALFMIEHTLSERGLFLPEVTT